jgi:hypothetical protein
MYTFEDAVLHAMAYLGAGAGAQGTGQSECRKAVLGAYRDLASEHTWSYLNTTGRIQMNSAFTDGTVTFEKSSGSVPELWTVAPGPLPSWAAFGSVRVGDVIYRVDRRISDTEFTTLAPYTPSDDIAEAQSFTLYQDVYPMPADFGTAGRLLYQQNLGGMSFVSMEDWQARGKYVNQMGEPNRYTFSGDPKYPGRLVVRVFPYPDQSKAIDFIYRRSFRPLRFELVNQGSATSTALSMAVAVAGNLGLSTDLIGSILRLSRNPSQPPTSEIGDNPYAFEGVITGYASNVLTVDREVTFSGSSLKYTVSDPIDVEPLSMLTAFLRGIERQLSITRVFDDRPSAANQYETALRRAKAADSRSFGGRVCGQATGYRVPLRDMPMSFD